MSVGSLETERAKSEWLRRLSLLKKVIFGVNHFFDRTIKEPSFFLQIQSKHRQVIASKFTKCFRGADYMVVFYGFFVIVQFFSRIQKNQQALPSHKYP